VNELLHNNVKFNVWIWQYVHDIDIAQCLVSHNVDIKNALLCCTDINVMRFLISVGANVNAKYSGNTPLHNSSSSEEVDILVSAGMQYDIPYLMI
jgi:ankyrin repeat protein